MMADHPDRQAANEFRLKSKIDEIAGLRVLQHEILADRRLGRCGKPNVRVAHPFTHDLFQSSKSAAHHK